MIDLHDPEIYVEPFEFFSPRRLFDIRLNIEAYKTVKILLFICFTISTISSLK